MRTRARFLDSGSGSVQRLLRDYRVTANFDRKWFGQNLSIDRQDNDMIATIQR